MVSRGERGDAEKDAKVSLCSELNRVIVTVIGTMLLDMRITHRALVRYSPLPHRRDDSTETDG